MSFLCLSAGCMAADRPGGKQMPWIRVAPDGKGFRQVGGDADGKIFVPWGFNYDHDPGGRLLEDYWQRKWPTVEQDFREMRQLGANVVRVHLQLGRFMDTPRRPSKAALDRLGKLLALARRERLYLDVTGLGCYHKKDVPPWYDALSEADRWAVQGRFWEAVARRCAPSPAVLCYDLMNEPTVGGAKKRADWLGGAFAGKHFVQFICIETRGRKRPDIAVAWTRQLVGAIRKHDRRHLVTVGLVPWSLPGGGLTSGFEPKRIAPEVDYLSVHLYPERGKIDQAMTTLRGFAVGKPVVIEETFPLKCDAAELARFLDRSHGTAHGWIGFYWGQTPQQLRPPKTIGEALTLGWLEMFQKRAPAVKAGRKPPLF